MDVAARQAGGDVPPGGKMHFSRMDEGTDADDEVLKAVHVPIETFAPMVHRVLHREWSPPEPSTD